MYKCIVHEDCTGNATHEGHFLDRIYTSRPMYCTVKSVRSPINNNKHLCAIAHPDPGASVTDVHKFRYQSLLRCRSPGRDADLISVLAQAL